MLKNSDKTNGHGEGKQKALDEAIGHIEKRFGKGAIQRLGSTVGRIAVQSIPSGSLGLDIATGVGGVPRGRVTEIYGPESSGKTTLAYHVVAEAQKLGGTALYIDVEHALDPGYAGCCGVNMDDLLVSQPDCGEQALEITEAVVRSGAVDVVVIDSVAALVPKAEIEGQMGDSHIGLQARLMSQALRKLCGAIAGNHTAVIFINQLREKVGVIFGSPETTPGGRALKFYASVRIDLRIKEPIKDGNSRVGHLVLAKVVKNKVAPPFRQAWFEVIFGHGISREGEILNLGEELGILSRKGSWYQWDAQILGQGREAARNFLREHQEAAREIENLIKAKSSTPAFRLEETAEYRVEKPGADGSNHDDEVKSATLFNAEEWQSQN
jgi:recombination protein RecA